MKTCRSEKIEAAVGLLKEIRVSMPELPHGDRMKINAVLQALEEGADDGTFCIECGCITVTKCMNCNAVY